LLGGRLRAYRTLSTTGALVLASEVYLADDLHAACSSVVVMAASARGHDV
jgi:hypothetical protein